MSTSSRDQRKREARRQLEDAKDFIAGALYLLDMADLDTAQQRARSAADAASRASDQLTHLVVFADGNGGR